MTWEPIIWLPPVLTRSEVCGWVAWLIAPPTCGQPTLPCCTAASCSEAVFSWRRLPCRTQRSCARTGRAQELWSGPPSWSRSGRARRSSAATPPSWGSSRSLARRNGSAGHSLGLLTRGSGKSRTSCFPHLGLPRDLCRWCSRLEDSGDDLRRRAGRTAARFFCWPPLPWSRVRLPPCCRACWWQLRTAGFPPAEPGLSSRRRRRLCRWQSWLGTRQHGASRTRWLPRKWSPSCCPARSPILSSEPGSRCSTDSYQRWCSRRSQRLTKDLSDTHRFQST